MKELTVPVTAPMPPELEARARVEAARRRISRAAFVRLAVASYLKQMENTPQTAAPVKAGKNE